MGLGAVFLYFFFFFRRQWESYIRRQKLTIYWSGGISFPPGKVLTTTVYGDDRVGSVLVSAARMIRASLVIGIRHNPDASLTQHGSLKMLPDLQRASYPDRTLPGGTDPATPSRGSGSGSGEGPNNPPWRRKSTCTRWDPAPGSRARRAKSRWQQLSTTAPPPPPANRATAATWAIHGIGSERQCVVNAIAG